MRAFPLVLILVVLLGASPAWAVKAFPTAEGFGAADTVGGRGGVVMEVTTLSDGTNPVPAGSFRACAEGTGPRTCVFRIGGVITLNGPIFIQEANSNLTIAGQTAPGEGITLTPWPINIQNGANHIIIRHLRHRQAFPSAPPNENNDCGGFTLYGPAKSVGEGGGHWHVHHVILDHVSTGYTCDDSMQMSGKVTDSTIQWSLVADPYECKRQPDNSCALDPYGASKGFIFGSNTPEVAAVSTGTVHHSMFLNTGTRNPGGGPQSVLDWRYNLIYNWGACTGGMRLGGTDENQVSSLRANHNFVGNRYIAGPETNTSGCWLGELRTEGNARVYVQDNVTPFCGMDSCAADEWFLGWGNGTAQSARASASPFRVDTPFAAPAITPTARSAMESTLAAKAGATVPKRDALDARVVQEMQTRTGNIGRRGAPFPTLPTSTAAPTDTDHDGMPDAWEVSHGLDPNNAADRNTIAANGYTNLENYLNELAGDDTGGEAPLTPTATPIYLSAGGHGDTPSDSGDCTVPENKDTPRATLAAALACMQVPGKVLYIRGGTYAGVINTRGGAIRGGPAADNPTRIEGYQAEGVTLQLPVGGVNALEINGISNFTVDKLTVDAMARADSNALVCKDSNNITIRNSHFRNAFFEVGYFNNCSTVEVTKSQFHDSMNATVISLVGTNTSVKFDELEVYNGPLQGIDAPASATNNSLTISRTQIRGTGTGAGGPALNLGGGSGALIVNNIIDHNNAGVRIRATARDAKISQNAVAANRGVGIQCDNGATAITISNNIAFSNGTDSVVNNCNAQPPP
jgi:Right handed beta helix region